jgi:hypothetical protein
VHVMLQQLRFGELAASRCLTLRGSDTSISVLNPY